LRAHPGGVSPSSTLDPVTIRIATRADAAACLAIYRPFVESTAVSFEEVVPTVEEFAARIEKSLSGWTWLVAEKDGGCIGYAYGHAHREPSCLPMVRRSDGLRGLQSSTTRCRAAALRAAVHRARGAGLLPCLRRRHAAERIQHGPAPQCRMRIHRHISLRWPEVRSMARCRLVSAQARANVAGCMSFGTLAAAGERR
jgi:hypothetical protein